MLNALECCVVARFSTGEGRLTALKELNLIIEKLRVLWRLVNARGWISAGQLLFSARKLDEIGRMAGGWVKATTPCSP